MSSTTPPPTAAASRVNPTTVDAAITALLKYKVAAQSSTEKLQLLPADDYIYLNLTLKKIPSNSRINPFKIPLSHPILDPTSQLCLIIDDRPKTLSPPSDQIKKLIKSQNIPISKVIKISKLKTDYKPFESKRKLCDSYDLFLVDKRVVHLLPKLLGKEFYKKKKLPLGVDLSKKNLKSQVEKALGSALLYLRTGTCCVMKVGKVAMEKDEVVENVVDAINGAVERVPKKWDGVRSLHLKFCDSIALPLYQAMPDVKLKIEGLKESGKGDETSKASDSEGEVKELSRTKDGKSGKKNKKGRIHEVRYMDVVDAMENDEDEDDKDESKKTEDEDLSIDETVGKKRSKSRAMKEVVLGELNGEKRAKKSAKLEKSAKSEKSGGGKPKKNELAGAEESSGKKGKRKTELAKKQSEKVTKVKDTKPKKRVSAK